MRLHVVGELVDASPAPARACTAVEAVGRAVVEEARDRRRRGSGSARCARRACGPRLAGAGDDGDALQALGGEQARQRSRQRAGCAANITTGVTATQATITRSSKEPRVRVAHPSMRSRPTIRIQPVSTSRAMAAGLVPRGGVPREGEREDQQRKDDVGAGEGLAEVPGAQPASAPMATSGLEQHAHEHGQR